MMNALARCRYFLIATMLVSVVVAVAIGMYRFERDALRQAYASTLSSVLQNSHQTIVEWIENQRRETRLWTANAELVSLTKDLLRAKAAGEDLETVDAQSRVRSLMRNYIAQRGYRGFFLIAKDGVNIASTRSQNIGTRNLLVYRLGTFKKLIAGETVLTLPQPSDLKLPNKQGDLVLGYPTMFVGAPLRDEAGDIIAVLTFRLDPAAEFSHILKRGQMGLSGETYAFDRTVTMISESRFEKDLERIGVLMPGQSSILSIELKDPGVNLMAGEMRREDDAVRLPTTMARQAVDGGVGLDLTGYRDYRGVPVIGAWMWDPTHELGIATEIDVREAYAPLRHAGFALSFLASLSSLLVVLLAYYGYSNDKRAKAEAQKLRTAMDAANKARVEAEDATQLKDKFVSLVAHDLRNPIGAIRGFAELSLDDKENPLVGQNRTSLEYILKQSNQLLDLITSLLDLSKLQTGKVEPEMRFLDAHFLAEDIINRLQPQAMPKGISLVNDIPKRTRLYADSRLFGQVLQNLVSNAIKFSQPGGTVGIYSPEGSPATVAVRDHGVGIADEMLDKLFVIEEKTSTVGTSGESGTGFGLPLSRQIIQAHHGDIRVETQKGMGSTFFAALPHVTPKVLVVEDDEDVRALVGAYLTQEGAEVTEVENGRQALDYIGRNDLPHLIVSDINMPVMDGVELLKVLHETIGENAVPVLVLTGEEKEDVRDQCLRLGAADFTFKPIVPRDFLPRVRLFIG